MQWNSASAPLRNAICHILLADELEGKLCSFTRLITPLNVLGGGVGSVEYAVVDHRIILDAFRQRGGDQEWIIPYSHF